MLGHGAVALPPNEVPEGTFTLCIESQEVILVMLIRLLDPEAGRIGRCVSAKALKQLSSEQRPALLGLALSLLLWGETEPKPLVCFPAGLAAFTFLRRVETRAYLCQSVRLV